VFGQEFESLTTKMTDTLHQLRFNQLNQLEIS